MHHVVHFSFDMVFLKQQIPIPFTGMRLQYLLYWFISNNWLLQSYETNSNKTNLNH